MIIQTDHVYFTSSDAGFDLNRGSGHRVFRRTVRFQQEVKAEEVKVMVALNGLDADNNDHLRIMVAAENISATGFDLVFSTWGNTLIYGVGAHYFVFAY